MISLVKTISELTFLAYSAKASQIVGVVATRVDGARQVNAGAVVG